MTWRKKKPKTSRVHWRGKSYYPVRLGRYDGSYVPGYMSAQKHGFFWNLDFTPYVDDDEGARFRDIEGIWREGSIVHRDDTYTLIKYKETIYRVMHKYYPDWIELL